MIEIIPANGGGCTKCWYYFFKFILLKRFEKMEEVLLHSCCAPCSSAIIEWMINNEIRPVIFYCNPNIYPEEEYLIRKAEITRYATNLGISIIDDDYDYETWKEYILYQLRRNEESPENLPERSNRCLECFRLRMLRSAQKCAELGLRRFTTTLASSRWKSLEQINIAGQWAASVVGNVEFWDRNWRKGGLQERRNQLLRENNFYNQLYCGCEYSMPK